MQSFPIRIVFEVIGRDSFFYALFKT